MNIEIKLIKFTSLRDGEKLYEKVLASAENTLPTRHPKIMDNMEVVRVMKQIVPEYKSQHSVYEVLDRE